jgi:putative transposase
MRYIEMNPIRVGMVSYCAEYRWSSYYENAVGKVLNQEAVLDRDDFKDIIEAMINRQTRPGVPGCPRIEDEGADYCVHSI